MIDARLLERIEPALGGYPAADALAALQRYREGASVETTARETGLSRHRIQQWVALAGITRDRDSVKAIQRAALARGRQRGDE